MNMFFFQMSEEKFLEKYSYTETWKININALTKYVYCVKVFFVLFF